MAMLTREAYERAAAFLRDGARELEHARFRHAFEDGEAEAVRAALARYRNDDGGFGHGLEPDAATPTSGALATARALQVLAEIGADPDDPLLVGAVAFLRVTLDEATLTWRIVPDDTDASPHAPWWAAEGLAERFGHYRINPRGELLAALYHLPDTVDDGWLHPVAEDCVRAIETSEMEMHDLLNAVALLEAPELPVGLRARVRGAVEDAAPALVSTEWDSWHAYGLQPVKVAPRPDSALHHLFVEPVPWNLDFLLQTQGEDGAWAPNWSWGAYPEAWEEARRAWQGVLTLEALRALRAYGRIEGVPPAP